MTTITQAEYARRHNVSRKTVTAWKTSGLITMTEGGVDVEASDERLRKYRNQYDERAQRGKAPGVTQTAKRPARGPGNAVTGNTAAGNSGLQGNAPSGRLTELPIAEIRRRLQELDWAQPAPTDEELRDRARQAARCVGLLAVESDLDDDGHWGGFQLRDPKHWDDPEAYPDERVAHGFGFELSPLDVLRLCRWEATLDGEGGWEDDDCCTVDLALLPALAHPHHEADRRPESDLP